MAIHDRVEINSKIMLGKPVIRGTRITGELILRKLSEGAREENLLDAHPKLKPKNIRAARPYAANALVREESFVHQAGSSGLEGSEDAISGTS